MGLGFLLPAAAVVTTALLVLLTDAPRGAKLSAVAVCAATFAIPRVVPAIWWSAGPLQAALSIVIILYLKAQGTIG